MKNLRAIHLPPDELPQRWYNIQPDLPAPLPPPLGDAQIQSLPNLMIGECLKQEFSNERWIDIPYEIQQLFLQAGRPRPLFRALNLEKALGTSARMYYKSEFFSPTGSHKVNTALAQCFYAVEQGFNRLTTETGAGQWGTALAYATSLVGLKCTVYWVRAVYNWKKDRRNLMELYGAEVFASPSDKTQAGLELYSKNPNHNGSLAIAISEGLEDSSRDPKAAYALGSVLNHVLMHQTIIGLETQKQFEIVDDYPDIVIACLGGGSNFGGFAIPFIGDALTKGKKTRFIAAQSQSAPNLQGKYAYDFADHAEKTPQLKMYTLGHQTDFPPIRGDGLRYHGCSPIISLLRNHGYIDTVAYPIDEKHVFESARKFMQAEGFIPAPESSYAVTCAIDEALKCKETGEEKVIAFNISGHGFLDIEGYRDVIGLK
ncbi:MAG: TrpB-like pyridoxal phosphate-dependent enzyme [Calditrichaeota bacterium]|nr:TrpB-like pyridoxal phosphate-dependent enzyme [Calditrichota bacterium]